MKNNSWHWSLLQIDISKVMFWTENGVQNRTYIMVSMIHVHGSVCVCVVCVWYVHTYVPLCARNGGPRPALSLSLITLDLDHFSQGLSLSLKLINSASWLASELQRFTYLCILHLSAGLTDPCCHIQLLYRD